MLKQTQMPLPTAVHTTLYITIMTPSPLVGVPRLFTGTLANSEDPDQMLLKAAFHQDLHYLAR